MRTSELTGGPLDAWTARAEGVPAAELELRANGALCVRNMPAVGMALPMALVLDYSTNGALTGPLVEKHQLNVVERSQGWRAYYTYSATGDTPLIAICRAVVRAAFGDEVEDLP